MIVLGKLLYFINLSLSICQLKAAYSSFMDYINEMWICLWITFCFKDLLMEISAHMLYQKIFKSFFVFGYWNFGTFLMIWILSLSQFLFFNFSSMDKLFDEINFSELSFELKSH